MCKCFFFSWATYSLMPNKNDQSSNWICLLFSFFFKFFFNFQFRQRAKRAWLGLAWKTLSWLKEFEPLSWRLALRKTRFQSQNLWCRAVCTLLTDLLCTNTENWQRLKRPSLAPKQLCRPDAPWLGQSCPPVSCFKVVVLPTACWLEFLRYIYPACSS